MLRIMVGVGRRKILLATQEEPEQVDISACSDDSTSSERQLDDQDSTSEHEFEESTENYIDWIRRATRIALHELTRAGLEDWVSVQRRWKWRWAGHSARRTDMRWATQVLSWTPQQGRRSRGHPARRWQDSITGYFRFRFDAPADLWITYAGDRDEWSKLEADFVKKDWSF